MRRPRPVFLRNLRGPDRVELMLVSAVATVLVIRGVLEALGYPKLAGKGLHIAHVLYGGILMVLALILVFTLLNVHAQWFGAFMAGVGFGFFIDEVGKFISNDVNYFFEPAVAVIYVCFIVLFLLLYALRRWTRKLTPPGALANALALLMTEQGGALDAETKRETSALLDEADSHDPLVLMLRRQVHAMPVIARQDLSWYPRARGRLASWYRHIVERPVFTKVVVVVAVLYALGNLPVAINLQLTDTGVDLERTNSDLAHWVQIGASSLEVLFVIIGLVMLRRSRLSAYHWFMRAILVSILVTQVFAFYHEQFTALVGLAFDLLFYAALRYMITREEAEALVADAPAPDPPPPADASLAPATG